MPRQRAGSHSIPNFLCSRKITAFIRSGSRAATLHPTHSAIRERSMAVDGAARTRRLPWYKSRDGLALCGSARAAGTAALSGLERPAAHRCRTCAFCGIGCCPRRTDPRQHPVPGTALDCSGSTDRLRRLSPCSRATPSMGGDACGLSRSHVMVVLDGVRTEPD
jgi:hypothetical protein